MRRAPLTLYAPVLVVVLVQGLIMAMAPSVPLSGEASTAAPGAVGTPSTSRGENVAPTSDGGVAVGAGGQAGGGGDAGPAPGSRPDAAGDGTPAGGGVPAAGEPQPVPSQDDGASPPASPTPGVEPGEQAVGDTSHCTRDGRQHDVIYLAPPCAPTWPEGADNGGATSRGVTADTIVVLLFREKKNEQVNAVLNAYNLRASRQQDATFLQLGEDYLNEYYEFYGRRVEFELFDATNCPESPPDVPACRAEVRRAIAEHDPFAVFWPTAIYPEVFDEFVRAGVIALGGWNFAGEYFAERRPYRYDLMMDGTQGADLAGEYWCKKLAGGMATHAGRVVHPSFPAAGTRDQQPRKLGIVTQETPATLPNAERLRDIVADCGDTQPELFSYQADVERAQQQTGAIVRAMIDAQVTSVICLCDPITPVFATQSASNSNYYPEWVLPGSNLLDYDLLGRLYDQRQWIHAFGPSHLYTFPEFEQTDAAKMARAMGRENEACRACNTNAGYINMLGFMLQVAGPELTPETVEQGLFASEPRGGWAATGGNPHEVLLQFGPGDYTALSDTREAYWNPNARSPIDGGLGAYTPVDGGRRYTFGQIPSAFDVPVPSR